MDRYDDQSGQEYMQGMPGEETTGEAAAAPPSPRIEKTRRKVSLIAAIVVNVVTVLIVAVVITAVLLPGYRRSFTVAKAIRGAEDVWIVVQTSESRMRENNTDFIRAQDSLRNALQELVESGGGDVHAYVRDNFPDQEWVRENLPDYMQQWLEGLYPKPEAENGDEGDGTTPQNGDTQADGETPSPGSGQ